MNAFFHPDSLYNHLRAAYDPGEKLYGYFLWRSRQSQSVRTATSSEASGRPTGAQLALAAASPPRIVALVHYGDRVEQVPTSKPVCVVVPAITGEAARRLRLTMGKLPVNADCRALFLHRNVLARVREVEPSLAELADNDETMVSRMVADGCLEQNLRVAEILSAVPELEAQIDGDGDVVFSQEELPDDSWNLDGETTIVLVINSARP